MIAEVRITPETEAGESVFFWYDGRREYLTLDTQKTPSRASRGMQNYARFHLLIEMRRIPAHNS